MTKEIVDIKNKKKNYIIIITPENKELIIDNITTEIKKTTGYIYIEQTGHGEDKMNKLYILYNTN